MDPKTQNVLRITRHFNASPERVFDAWLDPETASQWLFTSPTSEMNTTEIDARIGGVWSITDRRDGMDYTGGGEYIEIDRPHRLVFTFAMPQFSPDYDRITIEIAPDGAGCMLTLTHEGLPPNDTSATEQGWNEMFDVLAATLG